MSSREHHCPRCGRIWHCGGCDTSEDERLCDDCAAPPAPADAFAPAALDPGIRRTVTWLRSLGFETTDSGDGASKVGEMECAVDFPHVHMLGTTFGGLIDTAKRLREACRSANLPIESGTIQATYDPFDGSAVVSLYGIDDAKIGPALDAADEEASDL